MSVPDGLLVLLRDEPKHGYQLATDFADRTAGLWSLNTGQVYTTLDRLARDHLVEADGADPDDARRRRWRLTHDGAQRAERWLDAVPGQAGDRDELVLRVLLAAAADPAAALPVIDRQRRLQVARLQDLRRHQRAAGDTLLARLVADAAAVRLEAHLRWLDLSEERLRAAPAPSPSPRKATP